MNSIKLFALAVLAFPLSALAEVSVDLDALGTALGGWTKKGQQAAEYPLSGATYRTFRPETTPTPDGGLFVSLRIDHVRGWLSSDDHATLEITIAANGNIESAQSTIAIQGRSITTDLIRSGNEAGKKLVGVDRAVQIGTDLVADLTAKLLQEKIVEAGRVSYPAVLRHNYNLLYQAIRPAAAAPKPVPAPPAPPAPGPAAETPAAPEPLNPAPKLEIKTGGDSGGKSEIPAKQ